MRGADPGEVKITIGIEYSRGEWFDGLEVIADTGSTFTTVPRPPLEELGVPGERIVQSELADGRIVPVNAGLATIRLEGQEFPTPVILGEGRRVRGTRGCGMAGCGLPHGQDPFWGIQSAPTRRTGPRRSASGASWLTGPVGR